MAIRNSQFITVLGIALALTISSCAKKPAELYQDGMKAYEAGNYSKAQENFAAGIKKNADVNLCAGFIAANLVTGKYPGIITAYNQFSDGIRSEVEKTYGPRVVTALAITSELIPYNTSGGNKIPKDFPQTIVLQASADPGGYYFLTQQIVNIIKK